MREIKFRAWCNIEEKMYQKFYIEDHMKFAFMDELINSAQERYTLMQFTGLKDKNGVEIYEGDILKQEYTREYNDAYHPVTLGYVGGETDFGWHKGVVAITASNGACLRNPIHHSESYSVTEVTRMYKRIAGYRSEVIGNIYENPELLEDKR